MHRVDHGPVQIGGRRLHLPDGHSAVGMAFALGRYESTGTERAAWTAGLSRTDGGVGAGPVDGREGAGVHTLPEAGGQQEGAFGRREVFRRYAAAGAAWKHSVSRPERAGRRAARNVAAEAFPGG